MLFEDPGVLRASSITRLISFCCLTNQKDQIQSYEFSAKSTRRQSSLAPPKKGVRMNTVGPLLNHVPMKTVGPLSLVSNTPMHGPQDKE